MTAPAARLDLRVRQNLAITWPLVVGSLSTLLMTVADAAILGQYDTGQLAVMTRASPLFIFCTALLIPLGTAAQIVGSRWAGASDTHRLQRLLGEGLRLSTLLGLLLGAVLLAMATPLVALTGIGTDTGDDAVAATVLRILALGVPPVTVSAMARGWMGAQGLTKITMINSIVVNLANIVFDLVLVFGLDLGAVGSAWGTTAAGTLGAVITVAAALRVHRRTAAATGPVATDRSRRTVGRLWQVAWPDVVFGAVAYGADLLVITAVTSLGVIPLASYRIVASTVAIMFTVAYTCAAGVTILVGQRLGADDLPGGLAFARSGAVLMAVLTGAIALPVLVIPQMYARLFSSDPAVISELSTVLPIFWLIAPLIIIAMSMAAVVRGVGDTKSMMYIGLASQLIIAMPAAWLFGVVWGHGLPGVVVAMAIGWLVRSGLTGWRLRGIQRRVPTADQESAQAGHRPKTSRS